MFGRPSFFSFCTFAKKSGETRCNVLFFPVSPWHEEEKVWDPPLYGDWFAQSCMNNELILLAFKEKTKKTFLSLRSQKKLQKRQNHVLKDRKPTFFKSGLNVNLRWTQRKAEPLKIHRKQSLEVDGPFEVIKSELKKFGLESLRVERVKF